MRYADAQFALGSGASVVALAAAEAMAPPEDLSVSAWAEKYRFIGSESGSRHPGKWENRRVPIMVEVMDVCGVDHPAREVSICGGAQIAKSEAVANGLYHMARSEPRSALVILPSQDEFQKWNRVKFNTTIEATPDLQKHVVGVRSRSEDGSTTAYKRLRGDGFIQLTTASSSKGLQGLPVGYIIAEEVTEYDDDVGGRGDPLAQAEARMDAWGDEGKLIRVSTPGIKGSCRITAALDAGDRRVPYVPCVHCGDYITLEFEAMESDEDGPFFTCPSCSASIYEVHKMTLIAGHVWVPTFRAPDPAAPDDDGREDPDNPRPPKIIAPEEIGRWCSRESHIRLFGQPGGRDTAGRAPTFWAWQAYSGLGSWARIWARFQAAQADPTKLRTFYQQTLGEPYEERGDAPDHETLAEAWRAARRPEGIVPHWACMVTGFADVQGDRIEWGAYAWGPGPRGQLIAKGVIPGDPESPTTWAELGRVVRLTFPGERTVDLGFDRFLVDSGFKSPWVYLFCAGYPHVMATKGDRDPHAPELGTPTKVKAKIDGKVLGATQLYPLGQFGLKRRVYFGLKQGLNELETGAPQPGALLFHEGCDEGFFQQITAEYLNPNRTYKGQPAWDKPKHLQNEHLDIAVGALAGAWSFGLDRLTWEQWKDLFAARAKADADASLTPLEKLWGRADGAIGAEDPASAEERAELMTAAKDAIVKPVAANPSPKAARPAWARRLADLNKG